MRLLIFILCIFSCGITYSQNTTIFAPKGATWYYSAWTLFPPPPQFVFVSEGDTMINNINARIIQYYTIDSGIAYPVDSLNKFIYTLGNQVYYWVEDDFYLLFDFDAQPGDTIFSRAEYYPVFLGCDSDFSNGPVDFNYVIDSTGSINIDGVDLRTQYVTPVNTKGSIDWTLDGPIVERIGLFSYSNFWWGRGEGCILGGFSGLLRCYEDPDIYFKNLGDKFDLPCEFINGLEVTEDKLNSIYPNPATDILSLPANADLINIYNYTGQKLISCKKQNQIDITLLQPNIYFIHYRIDNVWYVEKFIKI